MPEEKACYSVKTIEEVRRVEGEFGRIWLGLAKERALGQGRARVGIGDARWTFQEAVRRLAAGWGGAEVREQ